MKSSSVSLGSVAIVLAALGTLVLSPGAHSQTVTKLYSFYCGPSDCADGLQPVAGLTQATNGYLYGVTPSGGAFRGSFAGGTVFKIGQNGLFTVLDNFCIAQNDCPDGYNAEGTLVQATNGALYGTTEEGDASAGNVFRITPSGTLTDLHALSGKTDGSLPYQPLIQAINGYLYGTTSSGGSGNGGTLFKITPSGSFNVLYNFCTEAACPDGRGPSGLVQATNGAFFGTTGGGAAPDAGTVFTITPSGTEQTLYTFCAQSGCPDGKAPTGLIQAAEGDFYGTTEAGGAHASAGTVYKITSTGALTTLHSFCALTRCADGAQPFAGLLQATDGNFYGTTRLGGAANQGTIFKITPSGTLTTVYSFCTESACADGEKPVAGLMQATNGDLYGVTIAGGTYNGGTIFRVSLSLSPFVKALPAVAAAGTAVTVFGTDLRGTTGVTFNGTAASFTQASATAVTAIVPAGATTGTIALTTAGGTLSSNVAFRVMH